ncbi:hypothetical protein AKO1_008218 [Acrasis kona]|uniref:Sodium/calcium exchanger membrane region domain-containing protein n=1 Tax=Acrasis kona TaxID=1008807 RepID=A0AAW2YPB4_9EUKA
MIPFLLVLMYSVGTIADSFLVPALLKLSDALRMPPSLAGVTLLALGNGAPDISTILIGVFTHKLDFALGDPIGGGLFDSMFVLGVICFAVPDARVSQLPFVRDVIFYLVSVCYIFYIFLDGHVTIYEGVICIVLYIIYVLIVVIGRIINVKVVQKHKQRKKEKMEKIKSITNENEEGSQTEVTIPKVGKDDEPEAETGDATHNNEEDTISMQDVITEVEIELDVQTEADTKSTAPLDVPKITIEEVITEPLTEDQLDKMQQKEDWTSGYTVQRRLSQDLKSRSLEQRKYELDQLSKSFDETKAKKMFDRRKSTGSDMMPSNSVAPTNPENIDPSLHIPPMTQHDDQPTIEVDQSSIKVDPEEPPKNIILRLLFMFVNLIGWKSMKWYEKILFVTLSWFPNLLQNLTIPKVDDQDWNRVYILCIPIFSPMIVLYAAGYQNFILMLGGVFPLAVLLLLVGCCCSILLFFIVRPHPEKPPKWFVPILVIYTFIMCVIWLYIVVSEIQNLLQAIGLSWGISEAILAITILAWSNSIGEFGCERVCGETWIHFNGCRSLLRRSNVKFIGWSRFGFYF